MLSRIFWKKSTAPFSKRSRSDMNKQPTNPTDFNEKTVKRHSPDTLTRAAKQTWSQSFTLHIQIARPWGRTFQSNSPLSGGQVLSNAPHLPRLPPPPPILGLNIDRCIIDETFAINAQTNWRTVHGSQTAGLQWSAGLSVKLFRFYNDITIISS